MMTVLATVMFCMSVDSMLKQLLNTFIIVLPLFRDSNVMGSVLINTYKFLQVFGIYTSTIKYCVIIRFPLFKMCKFMLVVGTHTST